MEPLCEFCGVMRAVVYCKSDTARLCLHCDGCVHSAHSLSRRHSRSLLCDKCYSQPAIIWCLDEKLSVCQACDWNGNGGCSSLGHRCHVLNCYTGCPSLAEFTKLWFSVLDSTSLNGSASNFLSLNENCGNTSLKQRNNEWSFGLPIDKFNELESCSMFKPWMGNSSTIPPHPNYMPCCNDHAPFFFEESNGPKDCSNFQDLKLQDGDDLCEGLRIDGVQLNFEAGDDEIFGCSQGTYSRYKFEDVETDRVINEKNLLVTESDGPIENAIEASSSGLQDCVTFQSLCVGGTSGVMQAMNSSANYMLVTPCCDRSINLGFPAGPGQIHLSMSLSVSNSPVKALPLIIKIVDCHQCF